MQHLGLPVAVGGPGNGSVAPTFVLCDVRFSQQCCWFVLVSFLAFGPEDEDTVRL